MDQIAIDFSQYAASKAKGTLSIQLVAGSKTRAILCRQNFDQSTGVEIDPTIVPLNARMLLEGKKQMQAQIDGIDAVLADMTVLGLDVSRA